MTDLIRQQVKEQLRQRSLRHRDIAERIGTHATSVSRLVNGSGEVPDLWVRLLDELDLELVVIPKPKGVAEPEQ